MYKELTFLKQIGEGSFGRVYMARWRETTVAVKVRNRSYEPTHSQAAACSDKTLGGIDSCPNCCLSPIAGAASADRRPSGR
jgi:serine/threonine protein kinase